MSKLTKAELVHGVSANVEGLTVAQVEKVIGATFQFISEQVAAGNSVPVPRFGTFETKKRAARMGKNPQTKEPVQISAKVVPVFKASAPLKALVNKD